MSPFLPPDPDVAQFFPPALPAAAGKSRLPKRGPGTLFYSFYANQLDLSRIADHKAHFMIALNVLMVSLVLTRKHTGLLSPDHYLLWPNLVLIATGLGSIVCAVIATRPVVPQRPPPGDTRPVNWFFFGSFCHRPLPEYHENIQRLMLDETALYQAMSRDLYLMGLSLAKKYRRLTQCYRFFYYGLLLTVAGYLLAFGWHFWDAGH